MAGKPYRRSGGKDNARHKAGRSADHLGIPEPAGPVRDPRRNGRARGVRLITALARLKCY